MSLNARKILLPEIILDMLVVGMMLTHGHLALFFLSLDSSD